MKSIAQILQENFKWLGFDIDGTHNFHAKERRVSKNNPIFTKKYADGRQKKAAALRTKRAKK